LNFEKDKEIGWADNIHNEAHYVASNTTFFKC